MMKIDVWNWQIMGFMNGFDQGSYGGGYPLQSQKPRKSVNRRQTAFEKSLVEQMNATSYPPSDNQSFLIVLEIYLRQKL